MLCEEARACMSARRKSSFDPEGSPQFETHLEHCQDCRELYQGHVLTEQMAMAWTDEAVPQWDRLAAHMPARQSTPWFTTLLPLAACLIMGFLVVSRVELVSDGTGWSMSFGKEPMGEAQVQAAITQALEAAALQNNQDMKLLLADYQLHTQQNMENMVAAASHQMRGERKDDLTGMVAAWSETREGDMLWVQERMQNIVLRQDRTHKNLSKIAKYVQQ